MTKRSLHAINAFYVTNFVCALIASPNTEEKKTPELTNRSVYLFVSIWMGF